MAFPYPYIGPIAPLNNLPIRADYYEPSAFFIMGITLGQTTLVTTTENHNYVVGQQVRLIIPSTFGCRQLNEQTGFVVSIPNPNQVQVSINSSVGVDAFISSSATTLPQILAIGDVNTGAINANGPAHTSTSIPGAFINISPL